MKSQSRSGHRSQSSTRADVGEPRGLASLLALSVVLIGLLVVPGSASAFEALDGRFQVHGFYEMQFRAINTDFRSDTDVTQWYHILNIEVEMDIIDETVGPIDLMSAFMRVEGRFDCVYSIAGHRGCGVFSGMDTYGDKARRLPRRLQNGNRAVVSGVIPVPERTTIDRRVREPDPKSSFYNPLYGVRETVPSTQTRVFGGPATLNGREPKKASDLAPLDAFSGFAGVDGIIGETHPILQEDDPFPLVFSKFDSFRFTAIETRGGSSSGFPIVTLGPWLPKNRVQPFSSMADVVNPFDDSTASEALKRAWYNLGVFVAVGAAAGTGPFLPSQIVPGIRDTYFEGVYVQGLTNTFGPNPTPAQISAYDDSLRTAGLTFRNAPTTRGGGALPFRPIPVKDEGRQYLGSSNRDARGLNYPTRYAIAEIESRQIDDFDYNFTETERAFNRGQSQRQTGELKELYLDIEMFDSRLWLRIGRQSIVWGKTELFRTTDQFNPQDLGLASLPSLEESRINLWAIRGVWSFYEVGPFSDVRAELAVNLDEFQGTDIGACGEPYAPNATCQLTFGAYAHGVFDAGVLGVDEPDTPWRDIRGFEFGGRLEWRWDRFSFALSDFYGFEDLPYLDRISTYERNVDPFTGRPRYMGSIGPCIASFDLSDGTTLQGLAPGPDTDGCLDAGPTHVSRLTFGGQIIPGSDDTQANQDNLGLGLSKADRFERSALTDSPFNQSLFAFICSTTIGFSAALDPASCGQSIFNSKVPQSGVPIVEFFGVLLKGGALGFAALGGLAPAGPTVLTDLVVALNADPNDQNLRGPCEDGNDTLPIPFPQGNACGTGNGISNLLSFAAGQLSDTLTAEQEALLGCGPLWGTDCDVSGVDLLTADASVLLQSFPGFPGTVVGWDSTGELMGSPASCPGNWVDLRDGSNNPIAYDTRLGATRSGYCIQPGTVGVRPGGDPIAEGKTFRGGEAGTFFIRDVRGRPDLKNLVSLSTGIFVRNGGLIQLPGSRGFRQPLYDAGTDGCVLNGYDGVGGSLCDSAADLIHPLSPSETLPSNDPGYIPDPNAPTLYFKSELAALSWNFLVVVAALDPEFNSADPLDGSKCSVAAAWRCNSIATLISTAGLLRNDVRAGGNGRFGRSTFLWQSGGEVVARYAKRNVLGFSMDFAEDVLKSNWSFEFTWFGKVPVTNNNEWDGLSNVQDFNLTMSVDRPTFINFLNPNRTFFFNLQVFMRYRYGYKAGMTVPGPWDFTGTLTVSTGYFQDRLLPSVTFVLNTGSKSGAAISQVTYRFTQNFSASFGVATFMGGTDLYRAPINPVGTSSAQNGENAYKVSAENGLSAVRDRDELFLRIRYTF